MKVVNGSTDVITYFVLRDSTNHAPKTDITVTDIDLYYVIEKAAISAKVDATALSAATDNHTDNYAFNIGQGVYRIDWPDTCFDGGVGTKCILIVVCSGVDTTFLEVELIGTHQTGDSYAIVSHADYGNAKLVRSTTPANTLSVDVNNKVAVPDNQKVDVNTIKTVAVAATATVTFQNGTIPITTDILNASAVAAAVWDAVASSYDDAGSMGALLNDAGAVGDPWNTALPGAYSAGKAGYILGTNLAAIYGATEKAAIDLLDDASGGLADIHTDIGTMQTMLTDIHGTDLPAVKTDTAAIKLKTDNLPSDPADQSAVEAAITAAHSTTNGKIDAVDDYVDTEIGTLVTELAKVPKSDGAVSWNATALAAIQGECTDALNAYDPPTKAELDTAQGAVTVSAIANNAITEASINNGAITNAKVADDVDVNVKTITAGAITAAAIANGAIDAATFAADVDAEIAAMVWNALYAAYGVAGSYGEALETILSNAADILTDTGTTLDGKINTIDTVVDLIEDIVRNQLEVTDANGNVVLRADDNVTALFTVAACVTDDLTTTIRKRLA